tara:strand:- start:125 stop:802 length:678 start_codon:yes stop_codon:yes gene_type:complete
MNILITGDSRGLGYELCKQYSASHSVTGISRSKHVDGQWNHLSHDLSLKTVPNQLLHALIETDVLIHNAAIASSKLAMIETLKSAEEQFDINFLSPFILTKAWMQHRLRLRKPGHVIFISSICSKRSFRGLSIYSATKSAINSYSKSIAFEMGKKNIRSNVVVPGYMETDMSSSLSDDQLKKIQSRCPMKRLAKIEEVCSAVGFLIESSDFINGSEIVVDGGYSL